MKKQVSCIDKTLEKIKNSPTYKLYTQEKESLENNERYLELIKLLETKLTVEEKKKYKEEYLELKVPILELQIQLNDLINLIIECYEKELNANNNGKNSCIC